MLITSIDVGLIHLGLVSAHYNEKKHKITKIKHCELINLTKMATYCKRNKCPYRDKKSKSVSHYLWHMFKKYKPLFGMSNIILLERQPHVGFTNVEQIFQYQFPDKSILINPRSMHKFLKIGDLDYEERKEATTKIANKYLGKLPNFKKNERKHDMSDAMCMILFHTSKMKHADAMKIENNPFKALIYIDK